MSEDGRFIDLEAGALTGEAASQPEGSASRSVTPWTQDSQEVGAGYYDRPILKEPVWIWSVPVYFFVGGAAGAAAVLGEACRLSGDPELEDLVRRCRVLAAAGSLAGGALLIHDLGRPERFLNMLRVFRPTSVLNMGSWTLAAFSGASSASVVLSGVPAAAAGSASAIAGLVMSGYTAVLLADTAVPLWREARRSLPPLFVAGAASGAASLLELTHLQPRGKSVLRSFALLGQAAELGAMSVLERDVGRRPEVGRALSGGVAGALWKLARAFGVTSLLLSMIAAVTERPWVRRAGASCGLVSGLALRFSVFHAGKASARDREATTGAAVSR